jgi:hypothetical protein
VQSWDCVKKVMNPLFKKTEGNFLTIISFSVKFLFRGVKREQFEVSDFVFGRHILVRVLSWQEIIVAFLC